MPFLLRGIKGPLKPIPGLKVGFVWIVPHREQPHCRTLPGPPGPHGGVRGSSPGPMRYLFSVPKIEVLA